MTIIDVAFYILVLIGFASISGQLGKIIKLLEDLTLRLRP